MKADFPSFGYAVSYPTKDVAHRKFITCHFTQKKFFIRFEVRNLTKPSYENGRSVIER
jgi:hypothetical protein